MQYTSVKNLFINYKNIQYAAKRVKKSILYLNKTQFISLI